MHTCVSMVYFILFLVSLFICIILIHLNKICKVLHTHGRPWPSVLSNPLKQDTYRNKHIGTLGAEAPAVAPWAVFFLNYIYKLCIKK